MSAGKSAAASSIAVVGGGIIGLSIAWRLAQAGWSVTVYEKGKLGAEASWAGAGMLSPGGEVHGHSELALLAVESRRLYKRFVRELERATNLAIDYQDCGALELAYSAGELEKLEGRAAGQAAIGIPSKPVSPATVGAFWPRVRTEGLAGARFYAEDGIVNPRDVLLALASACQRLGVALLQDCVVESATVEKDRLAVTGANGIDLHAGAIIAAGAWSGAVQVAGTPFLPPSEPIKGHLIGYHQPAQTCNTIVRDHKTYLLQRQNGLLVAGASVEHVGFDRSVQAKAAAELARRAGCILPHLTETVPTETWIGFRPGSDALHIGRWHSDRLYLAYGHYRNGILLAPVTAERIAAAVTANLERPSLARVVPSE